MAETRAEALPPGGLVEATERLYRSLFTAAAGFALAMAAWGILIAPFNSYRDSAVRTTLIGLALVLPAALLFARRREAFELLRRHAPLVLVAVVLSVGVLWADGGWRSSYYLASYSAIALAAVACGLRWSLACAALLASGYVLGLIVNGYSWSELQNLNDADSVVANTGGYLIAGYFFAAPVGWLARYVARINQIAAAQNPALEAPQRTRGLSARELQVLHLVVRGDTNQEIAAALHISDRTVQSHIENVRHKTGARNRTELAAIAASEGLAYTPR